MIGAIAGDIIGSRYERHPIKTTEFPLFDPACRFTDDTVLTVALADSILSGEGYIVKLKEYFQRYPNAGYGQRFVDWVTLVTITKPYNSWGNGSAMRVSPVGYAYDDLDEVLAKAKQSAEVTHNHPEGIKGAQAVATAIYLTRTDHSKADIKDYIEKTFGYDLNKRLDEIRPRYRFDVTCQGTVPPALIAFLESTDFEDAIRKGISLGGDSDTIACIVGGVAQAFYRGVPKPIAEQSLTYLDDHLRQVTIDFMNQIGQPI